MIPEAIRAAFRWWAKHPWEVFWGAILLYVVIVIALFPLHRPSFFVRRTIWLSLELIWILSFSRGVFVTWQRSKVRAVFAVVLLVICFVLIAKSIRWGTWGGDNRFDSRVKNDLRWAVTAQEAYFVDHETFTSNIDSLKGYGFNQSANVNINMEATATTFVITGTVKEGCKANTGTWFISITTGKITGTRCR